MKWKFLRFDSTWYYMLGAVTDVKLEAGLTLFFPGLKRDVPPEVRDVNLLIDQVLDIRKGINKKANNIDESGGEKLIFIDAFNGDEEKALVALSLFIKDVRTCPPCVIEFCQQTVNPRRDAA